MTMNNSLINREVKGKLIFDNEYRLDILRVAFYIFVTILFIYFLSWFQNLIRNPFAFWMDILIFAIISQLFYSRLNKNRNAPRYIYLDEGGRSLYLEYDRKSESIDLQNIQRVSLQTKLLRIGICHIQIILKDGRRIPITKYIDWFDGQRKRGGEIAASLGVPFDDVIYRGLGASVWVIIIFALTIIGLVYFVVNEYNNPSF